jgi:Ferrous iron transport protein B
MFSVSWCAKFRQVDAFQRTYWRAGKVAKYAGVTVETRSGAFETPAGRKLGLINLPGIYGLTARSSDGTRNERH